MHILPALLLSTLLDTTSPATALALPLARQVHEPRPKRHFYVTYLRKVHGRWYKFKRRLF